MSHSFLIDYHQLEDDSGSVLGDSTLDLSGEEVDALRGQYIRRLTAVLIHHVPVFWKVALSVSTGKFAKVSYSPSHFKYCFMT